MNKEKILACAGTAFMALGIFEWACGWLSGQTQGTISAAFKNLAEFVNSIPLVREGWFQACAFIAGVVCLSILLVESLSLLWFQIFQRNPSPLLQAIPVETTGESDRRFQQCRIELAKRIAECPVGTKSRKKAEAWFDKAKSDIFDFFGQAYLDAFKEHTSFPTVDDPPRVIRAIDCGKHWLEKRLASVQPNEIKPLPTTNTSS